MFPSVARLQYALLHHPLVTEVYLRQLKISVFIIEYRWTHQNFQRSFTALYLHREAEFPVGSIPLVFPLTYIWHFSTFLRISSGTLGDLTHIIWLVWVLCVCFRFAYNTQVHQHHLFLWSLSFLHCHCHHHLISLPLPSCHSLPLPHPFTTFLLLSSPPSLTSSPSSSVTIAQHDFGHLSHPPYTYLIDTLISYAECVYQWEGHGLVPSGPSLVVFPWSHGTALQGPLTMWNVPGMSLMQGLPRSVTWCLWSKSKIFTIGTLQ